MTTVSANSNIRLNLDIVNNLADLPFDVSLVGYCYLLEAVDLVTNSNSSMVNLSKDIYLQISKKYNVGVSHIDKSIRYLMVDACFNARKNCDIRFPNNIIKTSFISCNTKCFICAMSDLIKMKKINNNF